MKSKFKGKSRDDLEKSLKETRQELRKLHMSSNVSSTTKERQLRKDIARILTEINTQKS